VGYVVSFATDGQSETATQKPLLQFALDATQGTCQIPAMTWNGHDADALVAAFTKDGTFCNPDTYPGISGEALAEFVNKVWTAFPDFHAELLNAGEIEPDLVAHPG
jgi:SnoaL-like domain